MSSRKERRRRRAEEAAAGRTSSINASHTSHASHVPVVKANVAPMNVRAAVARANDETANDVTAHAATRPGPESLAPAMIDVESAEAPRVDADVVEDARWSPEAFARRARFARYVGGGVAACALLALVAFGVRSSRQASAGTISAQAANAVVAAPATPPPPVPAIPPPPAEEPTAEPDAVVLPPVEDEPAPTAITGSDRDLARRAKRESHLALEVGHVVQSIEAGQRAVALDPTDREAWLILGAAYLQHGEHPQAAEAFKSCLKEGTRGETWQCSAMLRR